MACAARCWRSLSTVAALLAFASPAAAGLRPTHPLVGAWRLVSYSDIPDSRPAVRAFGDNPIGLFVFTADGHVSISIMRNPPVAGAVADPDPDTCDPDWYCSYFGTYRIEAGAWVTHVVGGNVRSYLGTDQRRTFVIRGNRLIVFETYAERVRTVHAERVLVRAGGPG